MAIWLTLIIFMTCWTLNLDISIRVNQISRELRENRI